jgi:hypothetical protein
MKKILILLFTTFLSIHVYAQRGSYGNNFFGHLEFNSIDGRYKATLVKNIFNGLEFSDNANNSVEFDEKYLGRHYPGIMSDNPGKSALFRKLVRRMYREQGYKVKHSVDIFNKEIVEDNKGYKSESGRDIFGHDYFEEQGRDGALSIKRNVHGDLEYKWNNYSASIGKDVFGKWNFSDNEGNEIQFNSNSWNKMIQRFGSERDILWFLIDKIIDNNDQDYRDNNDY